MSGMTVFDAAPKLPRYCRRKLLANNRMAYYFEPPSWARREGCNLRPEALGSDYTSAVERVETLLLPAFDSWRSQGLSDMRPVSPAPGTFDWLVGIFQAHQKWDDLDSNTQRQYRYNLALVANHELKDGSRRGVEAIVRLHESLRRRTLSQTANRNESEQQWRYDRPRASSLRICCNGVLPAGLVRRPACRGKIGAGEQSIFTDGTEIPCAGTADTAHTNGYLGRTCRLQSCGDKARLSRNRNGCFVDMGVVATRTARVRRLRHFALSPKRAAKQRQDRASKEWRGSLVASIRRNRHRAFS